MMKLDDAIKTLDGIIPMYTSKTVDIEHIHIVQAQAWAIVKKELERYRELGTVEELDEALYNASL